MEEGVVYGCLCTVGGDLNVRPLVLQGGRLLIALSWQESADGMLILRHVEVTREHLKPRRGNRRAQWTIEQPVPLPD